MFPCREEKVAWDEYGEPIRYCVCIALHHGLFSLTQLLLSTSSCDFFFFFAFTLLLPSPFVRHEDYQIKETITALEEVHM